MELINFSKVSKLDGIRSWSLPALSSCPGAVENGEIVDACRHCYARQGRYKFSNVLDPRKRNMQGWKSDDWVNQMVKKLDNDRWFRWFDSGDIVSVKLAAKIYDVCKATYWCNHWIPTRSHKNDKILPVLEQLSDLNNVCVRYSSDSVSGDFDDIHGSTIYSDDEKLHEDVQKCRVSGKPKACNGCRMCWDKGVKIIGYQLHGRCIK